MSTVLIGSFLLNQTLNAARVIQILTLVRLQLNQTRVLQIGLRDSDLQLTYPPFRQYSPTPLESDETQKHESTTQ